MTAIITIFEIEFAGKEEVSRKVEQLSSDVKKIEGRIHLQPKIRQADGVFIDSQGKQNRLWDSLQHI